MLKFNRFLCLFLSLLLIITVLTPSAFALVVPGQYAGYYGDVNDDYTVDATDALLALRRAVGKITLDKKQFSSADVDGNRAIDASDALLILKYSVGKVETFPLGRFYDAYSVSEEGYVDCDATYTAYKQSDFDYDFSSSVNGAYANDTTADCSFVMDTTGLAEKTIYQISYKVLGNWDKERLFYSFQGLLNRDFGRDSQHTSLLYATVEDADKNWLKYMREEGSVFADYTIQTINSWDEFCTVFAHQLKDCGLVLWDGNVPATANVAATICGLDGYLPVLAESPLHAQLVDKGLEEKQSLVGLFQDGNKGKPLAGTSVKSSGSAKNDAYRWALEKYFDRCSANYLAYTLDGAITLYGYAAYPDHPLASWWDDHCLSNHDYLIARRCFFFDLSPYEEEICDDPAQQYLVSYACPHCHVTKYYDFDDFLMIDDPICKACYQSFSPDFDLVEETMMSGLGTDRETMLMIFDARYQRAKGAMGQLMGFPPWWVKYTSHDGRGEKAPTWIEWLYCELISCYNLAKEADAAYPSSMANGSAYYKYVPLVEKYENNWEAYRNKEKIKYNKDTMYFTIYVGDYDSSAWLKSYVNEFWIKNGRQRGQIPLTWCFNPNLSNRVPMVFDYVYSHKLEDEFITAGDSGAGYVIPSGLFGGMTLAYADMERPEANGNGDVMWANYCKKFYERFDMKATGFIINGANSLSTDILGMFNSFAPMGSLHNDSDVPMALYKGVPYVYCYNEVNYGTDTSVLYDHAWKMKQEGINFSAYRTICQSPVDITSIVWALEQYSEAQEQKMEYVELHTFLDLAKQSGQGEVIR
jgi:hypothetical protein